MNLTRSRHLAAALLVLGLFTAACGDDDDTDAASGDTTTSTTEAEATVPAEPEQLTVEAVDYDFEGLPDRIGVGSTLTLTNSSDRELHELVAIRLPDDEQRSVEELLALPEEEQQALLAGGPPAMVLVTPPGGEQITAVGDGTFSEPGRYLVLCAIPTGANPDEYLAAAQQSGGAPPQGVAGGAPHFVQGMFAEITVE